jgi:DNA-3-methyladenine glycosylase II
MSKVQHDRIERDLVAADPHLGRVISVVVARIGLLRVKRSRASPFEAIVRAIVYQSVSARAASVIFGRLKVKVGSPFTTSQLLSMHRDAIESVGLSKAKARAIHDLAELFQRNSELAMALPKMSDEQVTRALTVVPGIGQWTVNVFLIFGLGRLEVMPIGDLGIRRGVQLTDGLDRPATRGEVQTRARLWAPYRSIASMYLWNAVKLNISRTDIA